MYLVFKKFRKFCQPYECAAKVCQKISAGLFFCFSIPVMPISVSADARQNPFTTFDGETLAVYDWPLPTTHHLRAVILIVHGLGEHAWRYERLASELIHMGYVVRAYDQRGHGESVGVKGCLPSRNALLKDFAEVVDDTQTLLCKRHHLPLVVLGHSMGGLVAALWVARHIHKYGNAACPVSALVLSSPALAVPVHLGQRLLLNTLPRWMPNLVINNGINPEYLSHDPDVVAAYKADPLVHHKISPRLAQFLAEGGSRVLAYAGKWNIPTLLLYAGSDRLVDPEGSRRFAALAPKDLVQHHCYPKLYHEIFNELHRQEVVEHLLRWLDRRY